MASPFAGSCGPPVFLGWPLRRRLASISDSAAVGGGGGILSGMRRPRRDKPQFEGLEERRFLAITPAGPQVLISSFTTGDQFAPSISADSAGGYVVAWVDASLDGSGPGIVARRYAANGSPIGSEFLVNTITSGSQSQPVVASHGSGAFVVAWNNNGEIVARRYSFLGAPVEGTEFAVNTWTTGTQSSPAVAVEGDGELVITWNSNGQDGSGYGVYARRFDVAGVPKDASEFLVNQTTSGLQADPAVAVDGSGDFVIAWTSGTLSAPSQYDIYARRYDSAGSPIAGEFQVNSYTTDFQTFPDVAMDDSGDFVVAWQSYSQDGSQYGVYARRYNSAGSALGFEFGVNTFTAGNQLEPSVVMASGGSFIVSFTSHNQDGSGQGIYARGYSAIGSPAGLARLVNVSTSGNQSRSDVAVSGEGYARIAFQDASIDGSGAGVLAQRFGPARVLSAQYDPNIKSLVLVFSEDVSASLSLSQLSISPLVSPSSMNLTYNISTNTATIDFAPGYFNGLLPDGNYYATLGAGPVDFVANLLDGDADGTAGGDYLFNFFVLAGDANRDRAVNAIDLTILAQNWQGTGRTFTQGDFTYDGRVDVRDLLVLSNQWFFSLPEPAAPMAGPGASTSSPSRSRTRTPTRTLLA